jgi:hypothetical protein
VLLLRAKEFPGLWGKGTLDGRNFSIEFLPALFQSAALRL